MNEAFFPCATSPLVDKEFCRKAKTVREELSMRATRTLVRGKFSRAPPSSR